MLKTVLKYELRSAWRDMRQLPLAVLGLSVWLGLWLGVVERLTGAGWEGSYFVSKIFSWGSVIFNLMLLWIDVAAAVMALVHVWKSIGREMFDDGGCLTHTPPPELWQLLAGKALGNVILLAGMLLLFLLCGALCLLLAFSINGWLPMLMDGLRAAMEDITAHQGIAYAAFSGLVRLFFTAISGPMVLQLSVIFAQQFGKHKMVVSILGFALIMMLSVGVNRLTGNLLGVLIETILTSVLCFAGSWWLLKYRLNIG